MWCAINFTPNHNCVKSQLYHILMEDMKGNEDDIEIFSDCVDSMEELVLKGNDSATLHTISLQALLGAEYSQTMKMQGKIKNQVIIVLVDSGNTHNFLDSTVAKRLSYDLEPIQGLSMIVANRDTVLTQKASKNLA